MDKQFKLPNHIVQDSFESLWNSKKDWVEPINDRRGGWSGVVRRQYVLSDDELVWAYLKRQQKQMRRSLRSFFLSKPTYWFEAKMLEFLNKKTDLAPVMLAYDERHSDEGMQAILITQSLESYRSLYEWDQFFKQENSAEALDKKRCLELLATSLKQLHGIGIMHGALYDKHVYINKSFDHCCFIDFERSRFHWFSKKKRYKDIKRLFRRSEFLTQEDYRFFIKQYEKQAGFN